MSTQSLKNLSPVFFFIAANVIALMGCHNPSMEPVEPNVAAAPTPHIILTEAEFKWMDQPPMMPPGGKITVLEGDPAGTGEYTMRASLPPNYRVPPHFHPGDEHVTVLSGTFYAGLGDAFDEKQMKVLHAGGFMMMPKGCHHFAMVGVEGAMIQIHGNGPFGITYLNPKDDPRYK
jgi:quercetin dioxygenase-like cupin family protein